LYKWWKITLLSKTKGAREPCSHATGYIRDYKLSSYMLASSIYSKQQKVRLSTSKHLPQPISQSPAARWRALDV
jgi:hypothetical protein